MYLLEGDAQKVAFINLILIHQKVVRQIHENNENITIGLPWKLGKGEECEKIITSNIF